MNVQMKQQVRFVNGDLWCRFLRNKLLTEKSINLL